MECGASAPLSTTRLGASPRVARGAPARYQPPPAHSAPLPNRRERRSRTPAYRDGPLHHEPPSTTHHPRSTINNLRSSNHFTLNTSHLTLYTVYIPIIPVDDGCTSAISEEMRVRKTMAIVMMIATAVWMPSTVAFSLSEVSFS